MDNTNDALDELRVALTKALNQSDLNGRRTVCRRFYVTAEEAQQLEELRRGVNVSAFVRSKVFGSGIPRPRAIVPQINREAYTHLANLRGNCNQIAKAINSAAQRGEELPLGKAYLNQLQRIEEQLVAIGLRLEQVDATQQETEDDW